MSTSQVFPADTRKPWTTPMVEDLGPRKRGVGPITTLRQQLRESGYLPLPVNGKAPPMDDWPNVEATQEQIRLWASLFPYAKSTGILTRTAPTLDIDILHLEGADAVEALARERFEERGYFLVRFGLKPKRAIPFRTDTPFKKIARVLIAPDASEQKIEFLGDGQQVVVAGIHSKTGKPYEWFGGEPGQIKQEDLPYVTEADAQQFVDDAAQLLIDEHGFTAPEPRPKPVQNAEYGQVSGAADWSWLINNIQQGYQLHDSICSLAAKLATAGMGDGAAVNLIRATMENCTARDERWQERFDDIPRAVSSAREKWEKPQSKEPTPENLLSAFTFLGDAPAAPPKEIIKGLIPAEGVIILGGQSGAGKTFMEIHKAVCLAKGLPFFGYKIVECVGTAFVAAEGRPLIPNRFAAALAALEITGKLPIVWIKQVPDFSSADGFKLFIRQLKAIDERFRGDFGARLGQIPIDTITTAFSMKDEDDNAEATKICNVLRRISHETGAAASGVHHFGKTAEAGLRGASAFKGCSDVVLGALADIDPLSGKASDRELACMKARDGEQGPISPFELQFTRLGLDADGDIYGSCHVVPIDGQSRFDKTSKLSKGQRTIRDAITEGLDSGKMIIPRAGMAPVKAAKVEDVQAEFYRRYAVPTQDGSDAAKIHRAKYMAFKRALDTLPVKEFGAGTADGADWIWRV